MNDRDRKGVGIRAVATIIDGIILMVLGFLVAMGTGSTTGTGFALQGLPAMLWFAVGLAYYVVLEAEYGQTVGKRLVGIEVIGEDGGPIDYETSVLRNVLRIVDGFMLYLVGAILIWVSDDQQRLGDQVGNTYVVKTE